MIRYSCAILFCVTMLSPLTAQNKYDYSWVLGRKYSRHEIRFQADSFHYNYVTGPSIYQEGTCLSMSDAKGNFIFSSNGCHIYNRMHQLMENGDGLNPGWVQTAYCGGNAYTQMNAILSLPLPGSDSVYYVFHSDLQAFETLPFQWVDAAGNLLYSIVDMRLGNGLGAVTQKNVPVISDTLAHGALTAVRHANGRDWWILYPEENSNCYFKILFDPNGPQIVGKQCIGVSWSRAYSGGCLFTAKGDKYIRSNTDYGDHGLNLFDFDRCTGMLSNDVHISLLPDSLLISGLSISHNDRFVYVTFLLKVYQFDLWASDIAASKTLVASYASINQSDVHNPRLAPDGKIYITSVGDLKSLHIIRSPNKKGTDCRFESRGLELPAKATLAMPIFPNYRVGPVDNSSCDTLGIDNHPLARFTWEQEDVSEPLKVSFTDISDYEPTTWHWDFGDGIESLDTSPVHHYIQPGIYKVCLVVANDYSFDTLCRWINVDISSIKEGNDAPFEIKVFPNPFISSLALNCPEYMQGQVAIYDITGRQLATKNWSGRHLVWDLNELSSGVYFYKVHTDKGFSQVGKIIKK